MTIHVILHLASWKNRVPREGDCNEYIYLYYSRLQSENYLLYADNSKYCRIFHISFFSSSPRMNTCFNKLAAGLALLDTSYIIFRLLDTLRSKLQLKGIFLVFHAFVTYPIMNVLLFSLVLIPITLAYERYQSIK